MPSPGMSSAPGWIFGSSGRQSAGAITPSPSASLATGPPPPPPLPPAPGLGTVPEPPPLGGVGTGAAPGTGCQLGACATSCDEPATVRRWASEPSGLAVQTSLDES